ncbi:unnamed protein product [Rotaria magnacalcarata]
MIAPIRISMTKDTVKIRRLYREIQQLKKLSSSIFLLDYDPFSDDDESLTGSKAVPSLLIAGRILPTSEPFRQRSFRISITLTPEYPFEPPAVRFLTPIYHPNIMENGTICIKLLNGYWNYNPCVTFSDIIIAVEKQISTPDLEFSIRPNVAMEYMEKREEYNRQALQYVLQWGLPRV